jgi:hypothetical protein
MVAVCGFIRSNFKRYNYMESTGNVNMLPSYEVWVWIPKYEGRYEISNRGNIRSWVGNGGISKKTKGSYRFLPTPIKKKLTLDAKGYLFANVGSWERGNVLCIKAHRWVAKMFVPNPNKLPEANHLNGIKKCNEWWNFEWTTHFGNLNHAFKNGLIGLCVGEKQSQTKLNNESVLAIFKSNETTKSLSQKYKMSTHAILDIKRGRTWAHLTGIKRHLKPSEVGKYKKDYNDILSNS